MFLFVILFGLSMDYHVFILSRVREGFDRGLSTERGRRARHPQTAGVVTGAAMVMVAVFSVFAILPLPRPQGDGHRPRDRDPDRRHIVRAVLLPASMKLLGDANWYLPRWLEWLPRLEHEPAAPQGPTPTVDPAPTPA